MKWHLHITVKPHWNWTFVDVTEALKRDVERHGVKPLVITNHFHDGVRESYKELIPSKEVEGDEASASREIFKLGVLLNNSGWRIQRLKIEGDPREPSVMNRALYFETHLKNAPLPLRCAPISTTARGNTFHTLRAPRYTDILLRLMRLADQYDPHMKGFKYETEACVLDTNPDLDKEWISQCQDL